MLKLIPTPKKLEIFDDFISCTSVCLKSEISYERLKKATKKLPSNNSGISLFVEVEDLGKEEYEIDITKESIKISAKSEQGAFWGIQTLRQIFKNKNIPCLHIEDCPDFSYRGFYHDVTRGKVPTLDTLKKLVDEMAYYKMNSLQLYVEHTYEFEEFKDSIEKTGYMTAEETKALDDYCYENYIELIPSIACFGHLYELLQKPQYKELCVLENFEQDTHYWPNRMQHHTIDPQNPKSFEVVKSIIDQYMPLFKTNKFNICCDETFDLSKGRHKGKDTARLYVDFVKKLISYLQSKGKTVMMWADIVLKHPETLSEIPDSVEFLNWYYWTTPNEDDFKKFSDLNKIQIVCPGTSTWNRLSEGVKTAEKNIELLAELGKKYNARGMLNTNWGDWGNPCSLELCMYSFVWGGEKAWNADTIPNDEYFDKVNFLLYDNENGCRYIKELDELHSKIHWCEFAKIYSNLLYEKQFDIFIEPKEDLINAHKGLTEFIDRLSGEKWTKDEFRQEMLIAAQGLKIMAEIFAKHTGFSFENESDINKWILKYREKWISKNKEYELLEIEKMFKSLDSHYNK